MFAITAMVFIVFLGMGIDYGAGLSFKSRWNSSADTAAVGAIQGAEAYVAANSYNQSGATLTSGAIAAGEAQGLKLFAANAGSSVASETVTSNVIVTETGAIFNATVTYTGTVRNHFGELVGVSNLSVAGAASATGSVATYINYYIVVDVSNSMGIGATVADQTSLFNATKSLGYVQEGETGCVFGCHVAYNGSQYSNEYVAHNLVNPPVTLRIDAAKTAIGDVITEAKQAAGKGGNIKIALYTMQLNPNIPVYTGTNFLTAVLAPPSNNYTALAAAASTIDLGPNTVAGLGDTDQVDSLSYLANAIPANGNGLSATTPLNYVMVVTDGVLDIACGSWTGHCIGPMPSTTCSALQSKAAVGVVYTTYLPIYANNNSANGYEMDYNNMVLPIASGIQAGVQACASNSSLYFQANDGPSLIASLQTLFQSTLAITRLTQ